MASLCEQQSEEEGLAVLSVCGNDLAAGRKGDPIEAWGRAKRQSQARSGYCAIYSTVMLIFSETTEGSSGTWF